jgi:uncharacterized membrane protein
MTLFHAHSRWLRVGRLPPPKPTAHRVLLALARLASLAGLIVAACTDQTPTTPGTEGSAFAAGGSGPTVRSTVPASAPRDTTIDVLVQGSGFDRGSRAVWALDGDTTFQTTRITTNSTTVLNSRELIANITIEPDAELALFDVVVLTAGGKKGIGLERFEVTVQITALPMLGGTSASPSGINDAGVIVGQAVDEQERFHAVRWRGARGIWTIERLPGGDDAVAMRINNRGTIAGIRTGSSHAVLWTLGGRIVELGPGIPWDINDQETVVGSRTNEAITGFLQREPVVWIKTSPTTWGKPRVLRQLPNGQGSEVYAIDDAGLRLVGHAYDADGVERAVRWRLVGGVWQGPEIIPNSDWSAAFDINSSGDMAGSGCLQNPFPSGCSAKASVWRANGSRIVLDQPGVVGSHAAALNDAGVAVGFAWTEDRTFAFRWVPRTGAFEDIGTLIGDFQYEAADVNNHGQAVGLTIGEHGSDFLLRPVLWSLR